jgi:hypothetical protein
MEQISLLMDIIMVMRAIVPYFLAIGLSISLITPGEKG